MTAAEWDNCAHPSTMLQVLQGRRWDRHLRLFAVACCRRIEDRIENPCFHKAIRVAEQFADRQASRGELRQIKALARGFWGDSGSRLARELTSASAPHAAGVVFTVIQELTRGLDAEEAHTCRQAEQQAQVQILRELVGNPFENVTVPPECLLWRDGLVPRLAADIARERRFDDLPILADALEEAGCTTARLLEHCRNSQGHQHGCWALATILQDL